MINIDSIEDVQLAVKESPMVLLYFGGESCGVCLSTRPKVEEILKKYPNIKAYYIDVEKHVAIASKYSVFTMPALLLYIQEKETIREARNMSIKDIELKIDRYYTMFFDI